MSFELEQLVLTNRYNDGHRRSINHAMQLILCKCLLKITGDLLSDYFLSNQKSHVLCFTIPLQAHPRLPEPTHSQYMDNCPTNSMSSPASHLGVSRVSHSNNTSFSNGDPLAKNGKLRTSYFYFFKDILSNNTLKMKIVNLKAIRFCVAFLLGTIIFVKVLLLSR